jgi:hypothetical protein
MRIVDFGNTNSQSSIRTRAHGDGLALFFLCVLCDLGGEGFPDLLVFDLPLCAFVSFVVMRIVDFGNTNSQSSIRTRAHGDGLALFFLCVLCDLGSEGFPDLLVFDPPLCAFVSFVVKRFFDFANTNSHSAIRTRLPEKDTPSDSSRILCSKPASPGRAMRPPAATTRCQGRPFACRKAQTTWRAAPGKPAALATAP